MTANPEEAESIATEFVKTKKPDWTIEIEALKQKNGGWIVRGSVSRKEVSARRRNMITEKWRVEIEGGKVLDYEFTPGTGWTIA